MVKFSCSCIAMLHQDVNVYFSASSGVNLNSKYV